MPRPTIQLASDDTGAVKRRPLPLASATPRTQQGLRMSPRQREGALQLVRHSGLFDAAYYRTNYPAEQGSDDALLVHWFDVGCHAGQQPNVYFSPTWYLDQHPVVGRSQAHPLVHYLIEGDLLGYWPGPLFNTPWYRETHKLASKHCALAHYLAHCTSRIHSPLPEFDPRYYASQVSDQVSPETDLFAHFLVEGFRDGLNPSAQFDVKSYAQKHLSGSLKVNPIYHWLDRKKPIPLSEGAATAPLAPHRVISSDWSATRQGTVCGSLDAFSVEDGLTGWVMARQSPATRIALELVVEGNVIWTGHTSLTRRDIAVLCPEHTVTPGFSIPVEAFASVSHFLKLMPDADYFIRVAGTREILARPARLPNLNALTKAWNAVGVEQTDANEMMLGRLAELRQHAAPMARCPLRPDEAARVGYIEVLCTVDQNEQLTWFIGWTTLAALADHALVIVDRTKWLGGLIVATYPRDDLQAAVGVVGVIHSDWRAFSDSQPVIYLDGEHKTHLMGIPEIKRVPKREIIEHIKVLQDRYPARAWSDFLKLLHGRSSWEVAPGSARGVRAAVDRVLIVPGLGCFASGWVLSPLQTVAGLSLKIGDVVLSQEPSSVSFFSRPDIGQAYPDAKHLATQAGFRAFFWGAVDVSSMDAPLLKVILQRDASVHTIDPVCVRRLGHSESIESLTDIYPAIETASFLPHVVRAVRDDYRARARHVQVIRRARGERAVVVCLGSNRADALLSVDTLRDQALRYLPSDACLVIIADSVHSQSGLLDLMAAWDETLLARCALVLMSEPMGALEVLHDVLLLCQSSRFLFVGVDHGLTASGWQTAHDLLMDVSDSLTFLGLEDPDSLATQASDGACFCWTTQAYLQSRRLLPPMIDAYPKPLDYAASGVSVRELPATAFAFHLTLPPRLTHYINGFNAAVNS